MPHGEEETAELAKTASFDKLRMSGSFDKLRMSGSFDKLRMSARGEPVEPGVLRGSFVSGRPEGLHYTGMKNAVARRVTAHPEPVESPLILSPSSHRSSWALRVTAHPESFESPLILGPSSHRSP
jgi:hypothetical protein